MPLTQPEYQAIIRRRIASGELPREVETTILAGPGEQQPCALCQKPVEKDQIEYLVKEVGGHSFRFHIHCHATWDRVLRNSINAP